MATIRLAKLTDLTKIKEYRDIASKESDFVNKATEEQIRKVLTDYIDSEDHFYYVVIEKDKVIGLLIMKIQTDTLFIQNISLLNESQGKGIAVSLINEAEKLLHKNKLSRIELKVRNDNDKAISFYKKMNFKLLNKGKHNSLYEKEFKKKDVKPIFSKW